MEADEEAVKDVELVIEGDPVLVAESDALPLAVELSLAVTLADPLTVLLPLDVSQGDPEPEMEAAGVSE